MKKTLLRICLFFCTGLGVLSCSRADIDDQNQVYEVGELNETGEAFMNVVMTRSGWEQEWQQICDTGIPVPNEAVQICYLPNRAYYVIPIVKQKEITSHPSKTH